MNKLITIFCIIFFFSCDNNENRYASQGKSICVTVFLYENCPIAQYMCGPLRNTYRYFADTLNSPIVFRGFSPNAFSTSESINNFKSKYDIPFSLNIDYDHINDTIGLNTQRYQPVVTPEVFIEIDERLIYRGMIDNSYQSLGQWTPPTHNFLRETLNNIVNEERVEYFETTAVGCIINY